MPSKKKLGGCLMGGGAVWLVGWAVAFAAGYAGDELDLPAAIVGALVFGLPPSVALVVIGTIMRSRAIQHKAAEADAKREARLLSVIETAGSITISEIGRELGLTDEQVREHIYDLVAEGRFSGYVNWDAQRVYSVAAGRMPADRCPNCGGELELAGKDTVVCPYCDNEVFLADAAR